LNIKSFLLPMESTHHEDIRMKTSTLPFALPALSLAMAVFLSTPAAADDDDSCAGLPSHAALQSALAAAVTDESSGLKNNMWATVVNRDGVVCAVAFTGADRGSQWPGSRVISAQKANTANSFSLPKTLVLSTANLYTAVQPGGSLYGLQHSNPVDTGVAYQGPSKNYGQSNDPMVGRKIGGVNVFGGGLALYSSNGTLLGAVGVSGDTSCTDHDVAWRTRNKLNLDFLATAAIKGVSGDLTRPDNIVYDITSNPSGGTGISAGGFGHPMCINTGNQLALPVVR
jgi:uncharacterized protein GlcG (DUF336 family)